MVVSNGKESLSSAYVGGRELGSIWVGDHLVWEKKSDVDERCEFKLVIGTVNGFTENIGCDSGFDIKSEIDYCNTFKGGVTDLVIGSCQTDIPEKLIYNKSELSSLTICNGVETIGYAAFSDDRNLNDIVIPSSVNEIGFGAFNLAYRYDENGEQYLKDTNANRRVIMKGKTPPKIVRTHYEDTDTYDGWPFTVQIVRATTSESEVGTYPIYVPDDALSAYRTAEVWKNHRSRIKPMSQYE